MGCNLCSLVCPVTDCIEMVEVPSGLPEVSLREYQAGLAAGTLAPIEPPSPE